MGVDPSVGQEAAQNKSTRALDENRNSALKSVATYKLSQFMLKNTSESK
jgi:hypothetical protein